MYIFSKRRAFTLGAGIVDECRQPAIGIHRQVEVLVYKEVVARALADDFEIVHERGLKGDGFGARLNRNLEVPSGGAVGTARAIAHAYSVFGTGGSELGLRPETLQLLSAPPVAPRRGFYDECMKAEGVQFSLGFMKPSRVWWFGSARSFGSPGAGGSLGFADPEAGIGYAYVTSKVGTRLIGDPRDVALRDALYHSIPASSVRKENTLAA
jgi:CubicO group peptidase (beta-lactamase class C family)